MKLAIIYFLFYIARFEASEITPTRVNMSLNIIYERYKMDIQYKIENPDIKVFDVYDQEETIHDENNHEVILHNINMNKIGHLKTIKAITDRNTNETAIESFHEDEILMKLEREKRYYLFFDPEIDKQIIPEIYYISKESCEENKCYFVLLDYFNNDLETHYAGHCVDNIEELLEIFTNMADTINSLHTKKIVHCNIALKRFLIKADGLGYFITNFGLVNENNECRISDSNFNLPKSAFYGIDLKHRLDFILKQDIYALGFAFIELLHENSTDEADKTKVDLSSLDELSLNTVFERFGCMCAKHIDISEDYTRYIHVLDHAFKEQLKVLIKNMISKDLKQIPDAEMVYNKLAYLTHLYKRMKKEDIFNRSCVHLTPEKCLKTLVGRTFTKKISPII